MSKLAKQTSQLIDMMTESDIITYEGYCKLRNQELDQIDRSTWDDIAKVCIGKTMLYSHALKTQIMHIQETLREEDLCQTV